MLLLNDTGVFLLGEYELAPRLGIKDGLGLGGGDSSIARLDGGLDAKVTICLYAPGRLV